MREPEGGRPPIVSDAAGRVDHAPDDARCSASPPVDIGVGGPRPCFPMSLGRRGEDGVNPDPADDPRVQLALDLREKYYLELAKFAIHLGCSISDARHFAEESVIDLAMREPDHADGPIRNERAWLYRVVRNKAYSLFRRHRRAVPVAEFTPESLVDPSVNPETYVVLLDAIRRLPPKLRVAFALYLGGLTYQDIAEILDCTIDTAKQRVSRARKELRRKLED